MNQGERSDLGQRISKITIIWNIILSAIKLIAGVIGNSGAMLADGVHSLSDIISTIAVFIALHLSKQPEDDDHPYGHEKIEPVIAKILATILFLTAVGIGYEGVQRLISGEYETPGIIALYAAILSIIVKEWMYRYTLKGAEDIDSAVLKADAWHHRSDVLSSIGTLIAIGGARLGYNILEPLASLVISGLIIKVAIDIYTQSVNQLVDYAGDQETVNQIRDDILAVDGVIEIHTLKTRVHVNKLYVDTAIAVDANLTVLEGHTIARNVHDKIESSEYQVKHCMVHVDPYLEE